MPFTKTPGSNGDHIVAAQPNAVSSHAEAATVSNLTVTVADLMVAKPEEAKRPVEPGLPPRPVLALFCAETVDSLIGQEVMQLVPVLVQRGIEVHLFCRHDFALNGPGIHLHQVSQTNGNDLLEGVEDFTRQASAAFGQAFHDGNTPNALVGMEWSTIPVLQTLRTHTGLDYLLSLHSLEQQRRVANSELSHFIEEIEAIGLGSARTILVHDETAEKLIRSRMPDSAARLTTSAKPFPTASFTGVKDPGTIKARYQIGPVDPMILFVGCVNDLHGPDILMRSVPAIVKNHPKARFVFVGDGDMLWPIRVYARYLLLEPVVRLLGHLEGDPVHELISAADVVVVPSRGPTELWPIQAAWAAKRPVVASHSLAVNGLLEHERDAVLVYPHESSVVWGVERLLFDPNLGQRLGERGHEKLEERFGWNSVALQLETLTGIRQPR
jgi:glycosyltransferase involved in cell wall biosynthesis